MSDGKEAALEQAISDKLDGSELGSEEMNILSQQLANELGFEGHDLVTGPTPEQRKVLSILEEKPAEAPAEEVVETPEPEQAQKYTYTRDDGTVKTFDDRESYLEYKIGADANKWADKFRDLEQKMESRGEQPPQTQQPAQKPEELLFEESVLKNEEWAPVVQVMTKAFEKFYALQNQELQGKFDALDSQFGELKMTAAESAVRQEFGIDRATEQEVLEKQPQMVRDGLTKMDPAARLAVIRQLKGQSEAAVQAPPTIPRAVPPQQAHVESSVRGEPDRDPEGEFFEKFTKMGEKEQLGMLGQLFKGDRDSTF